MKVNGIIAEYNPFHNGHQHQIYASKELTGADHTIVCLSGNFVQRGAPALTDKHTRAEMALRSGADLVLELPTPYATASAEYFAAGAVALLCRLGVVTHLCFGSECGDISKLYRIAQTLRQEPEDFRCSLKSSLKEGMNFPAARAKALSDCFPELVGQEDILASPNNILGIEYIKALLRRNSPIEPVTIRRIGAGYHDTGKFFTASYGIPDSDCSRSSDRVPGSDCNRGSDRVPGPDCSHGSDRVPGPDCSLGSDRVPGSDCNRGSDCVPGPAECSRRPEDDVPRASEYASALSIRQALLGGKPFAEVQKNMPPEAAALLDRRLKQAPPLCENDLSLLLYYKLLTEQDKGYTRYADVSGDLSDRIRNKLKEYHGFDAFCDLLKTKELTRSRISRCLLHIILGITNDDYIACEAAGLAPYARVLGFRRDASALLSAIKANAEIPLITKLADGEDRLPPDYALLLQKEIQRSQIYHGLAADKTKGVPANEYTLPVVIV